MRERYYSAYNQRSISAVTTLPWFEIQLWTITGPSSTEQEIPADMPPDELIDGELDDEDLCSEHSVRVLGYQQAVSRHEACERHAAENGFESSDRMLDFYIGLPDQITELVAQEDINAWVEIDPEEYLESHIWSDSV